MIANAKVILFWAIECILIAFMIVLSVFIWKNGSSPAEVHISPLRERQLSQYSIIVRIVGNLAGQAAKLPLNAGSSAHAAILYWQAACVSDAAARQLPPDFALDLDSFSQTYSNFAVRYLSMQKTHINQRLLRLLKFKPISFMVSNLTKRDKRYLSASTAYKDIISDGDPSVALIHNRRFYHRYLQFSRIMIASLIMRASELAKLGHHAYAGVLFWQAYTVGNVMTHEASAMGVNSSAWKLNVDALNLAQMQFRLAKGGLENDFDKLMTIQSRYDR